MGCLCLLVYNTTFSEKKPNNFGKLCLKINGGPVIRDSAVFASPETEKAGISRALLENLLFLIFFKDEKNGALPVRPERAIA